MEVIERTVREEARNMKPGQNARLVCPACEAGHEKSFSINRDAFEPQKVWFRCWRAACGIHGLVTDAEGILLKAISADDDVELAQIPVLNMMPRPMLCELACQLNLNPVDLDGQNLQYDPHTQTMYYPWYNWNTSRLRQVGWQKRTPDKVIRLVPTYPVTAHYSVPMGCPRSGPTVFVENLWSAYKLKALGYRAVALLGHRLPAEVASATRTPGVRAEAVLLLDPDCWPTKVSDALRNLESRGWAAHAVHIKEKPHTMSQEDLLALIA